MEENKLLDFFKSFDPNALRKLEGLNITKIIKQLEQLKLSGLLERLEDINKLNTLLKKMDDVKLSELVKQVEDIKLSKILKQLEENKLPDLLKQIDLIPAAFKGSKAEAIDFADGVIKNVTIQHKQDSIPDQIQKLAELRELGILTNDEFQSKKKQLLERM
jgi:hypothetical protein